MIRFCASFLFALTLVCSVSAEDAGGVTTSTRASSSTGIGGGVTLGGSTSYSASTTGVGGTISNNSRAGKSGDLEKQAGKRSNSSSAGGPSVGAQAGHYFLSRWYDLADVFDFSFGAGPGFMVNAHATKLVQAVGGWGDSYHVGFRGRSPGIWREKRKEIGVSLLYYQQVERERVTGWVENFRTDKMDLDTSAVYANSVDRSFLGVGVQVQAGVMINANVRPMQAVDFVLGWFTIDVLEDDTGKMKRNKDL
jgi:hypothetical protein